MRSITQIPTTFIYQSYLAAGRMLLQGVGNPIIDSTRRYAQTPGVGLALHPCSQSPVAVKFKGGKLDTAVVTLTPGQKIITGPFSEFEWGLPFGWLGGGTSVLYVIHNEKADVTFPSVRPVVIFHRLQLTIVNGNVDAAPVINWPNQFPWSNAIRVSGGNNQPQPAAPIFSVDPDVALFRLNLTGFLAPVTLTLQIRNVDAFDLKSDPDQTAGYTNVNQFYDLTFNPVAGPNTPAVAWLPAEVARLGGDSAAVSILDTAGVLAGSTVDVIRYGRIG